MLHQATLRLTVIAALACGCGLDPLPKLKDSGASSVDSGQSNVVQLGDLRIEPATLAFGVAALNEQATDSVLLSNTGDNAIIVRQAYLEGDATFELISSTTLPAQLEGGGEVLVEVGFTPTAAESYTSLLTLDVNSLDEAFVMDVSGAGEGAVIDTGDTDTDTDPPVGELVAAPTSADFEDVPTNRAEAYDITLTNNHSDNILIQQINGSSGEFGYQGGGEIILPQVLTPDESRVLTLTFEPNEERAYSGTVDLTLDVSGNPGTLSIPVQGVGIEPPCDLCQPVVNVSPNPIEVRTLWGCDASQAVTVTNTGDVELVVTDAYVTNDSFVECGTLSLSGTTTATVPPGSSFGLTIDFAATATACTEIPSLSRDANILHLTNNSGQPDYKVEVNAFATCL
jgi:hypothetical protein